MSPRPLLVPASTRLPDNHSLVLVPTQLELDILNSLAPASDWQYAAIVCGFGPVSAAVGTLAAIADLQPARVILAGIAGCFTGERIGSAAVFQSVQLDGIGLPSGDRLQSGHELGFDPSLPNHLDDLICPAGACRLESLLTVCVPSENLAEAEQRRIRFAPAAGEDMEGFGVAAACRNRNVPLTIVRGFSNLVGDRRQKNWQITTALTAVAELLPTLCEPPTRAQNLSENH